MQLYLDYMFRFYINKSLQSKDILKKAVWAFALLVILMVPVFLNPEKISYPACFFKSITGYSCLSCGLSRSLYEISHLHLVESIKFHLMGPIIYFALLFLFLKFSFETVSGKDIRIKAAPIITKITLLTFLCLWLCFGIFRFLSEI